MKVVILAGGFGTRLSEETDIKPKPMVEIGSKPILWHIIKIYSTYGFNDFIVCLGYKGYIIKEYFYNYFLHLSDITINLCNNEIIYHKTKAENWKITLVDTGLESMTGERIRRIKPYLENQTFMLTYGDGVANINIKTLCDYHKSHGKYATMTAVQPEGRFGLINLDGKNIKSFIEKPKGDGGWINAGFFVLEPEIFNYIEEENSVWEKKPLEKLASENQLVAYLHEGFWKCMDTLRDKLELENLWKSGQCPWKVWED
ncbi:MAG: glucose-1-phosphate cytidylyltransferase [Candidatus Parvarchaeum sp.]